MKPLVLLLFAVGVTQGRVIPTGGVVVSSQYHAQDELGQYSYGYAGGPSAKQETKTADGITKGGYSYIDGHGLVQSAAYVSDPVNGFRVAATNLPVGPPVPTGDVISEVVAAPAPVAVAPVAVAPAPVAVAPAPVAVAPAPVALAPAPVAVAPAPVALAPAPVPVAPAPVAVAPSPAVVAPVSPVNHVIAPAPLPAAPIPSEPAPVSPPEDYADDDTTVIESADFLARGSLPVGVPAPLSHTAVPVADALAVENARAAHLAAIEEAKARDAIRASSVAAAPLISAAKAAVVGPAPLIGAPVVHASPVVVGVTSSQYHAQNELGEYSYGYAGGPSAKQEIKTFDGITRGGYSYVDADGLVQSAAYVSDPHNGFRVAATNLPVQPAPTYLADTHEVAEAKARLFQAQAEHIAKL